jgi:dihydrofolate synthase/folylpolyglutamate synthase
VDEARFLLDRLNNPQNQYPVIHVAGTNGKGSVCAMISTVLQEAGYRTGLFTSPHLIDVYERITIDGIPISENEYSCSLNRLRFDAQPHFFTLHTVIAFDYFARMKVDIAVIETGIGGQLDATNAVNEPLLTVITSIGHDHMEMLGNTLEQIAASKAGIIKKNRPVALGLTADHPNIIKKAIQEKAPMHKATDPCDWEVHSYGWNKTLFSVRNANISLNNIRLSLSGEYQVPNAALALTALHVVNHSGYPVTDGHIRSGFSKTRWPGRFEMHEGSPPVVFDGAHNREGAIYLRESIHRYFSGKKVAVVVGMLRNKDAESFLNELYETADIFICTRPPHDRALPENELSSKINNQHVITRSVPSDAFKEAEESAGPDGAVVITGSFYLYGDFVKWRMA